ncbi:MAG: autotransporter outer membrane beta-barrel domain-containing protein, partial [Ignavibacteriales bacterium]
IQQNRYGRELVLDRAATRAEGRGAWAQLLGGDLKFDGSSDYGAIDSEARGLVGGIDAAVGAWRAGAAVSYVTSDVDSAALAGKADVRSAAISGYLGGQVGQLTASIGASYSHHDIEADRSVAFPGFADAPTADFQAHGFDLFGEVSVRQPVAGLTVEPFLGVSYESLHVGGFSEKGGQAALTFASSDREVSTAELGVRVSASIDTAAGRLTPYASVAWRGVSGDDKQLLDAAFRNGATYAVDGAPIDDGAVYDLGVRLESGRMRFKASYAGMDTDRWSDRQGRVGLSVRF